jgi:hypothetical protein
LFALLESSILKIYGCTFTQVALVNGLAMGGGAALVAPLKFAVVTEKTVRDTIPTFLCFYATLMVYFFNINWVIDFTNVCLHLLLS